MGKKKRPQQGKPQAMSLEEFNKQAAFNSVSAPRVSDLMNAPQWDKVDLNMNKDPA